MRGATAVQLIACCVALLTAFPARGDEPEHKPSPLRIAVFDVRATGVDESTARTISEVLAVEVSKLPNTVVITNAEIESLLGLERKKQMLGCSDDVSCVAEIAGSLGVDKICTGSLGKISETNVLTLRVLDVKSAKVDNRLYEKDKVDASAFLERMPDIVAKLFPAPKSEAKVEPKTEPDVKPEQPKAETAGYNPAKPYVSPAATPAAPPFSIYPYLQSWKTWAVATGAFFLLSGATYRASPGAAVTFFGLTFVSAGLATSTCVCNSPFGSGADAPPVTLVRPEPPASAN